MQTKPWLFIEQISQARPSSSRPVSSRLLLSEAHQTKSERVALDQTRIAEEEEEEED